MMYELSLNILDIAQNSIAADATFIEIDVEENDSANTLVIRVKDNGKGMDEQFLKTVENPFITTRSTRKIGLGISFFKEAAEITGGSIKIESAPGKGTTITGLFIKDHIDLQPIGDLTGTIIALVSLNTGIDFAVRYKVNENEFIFSTMDVKEMLGEYNELNHPAIISFLTEYINEHIENLSGGAK
jgi:hypothetical protein